MVSIHARHCCRANPKKMTWAAEGLSFQSTPGIAAGRIMSCSHFDSIEISFNPRPALLPGESSTPLSSAKPLSPFQSTPGIAAGRICMSTYLVSVCGSFNPRPALLPGESGFLVFNWCGVTKFQSTPGIAAGRISVCNTRDHEHTRVSIHARHCCRANLKRRNLYY